MGLIIGVTRARWDSSAERGESLMSLKTPTLPKVIVSWPFALRAAIYTSFLATRLGVASLEQNTTHISHDQTLAPGLRQWPVSALAMLRDRLLETTLKKCAADGSPNDS